MQLHANNPKPVHRTCLWVLLLGWAAVFALLSFLLSTAISASTSREGAGVGAIHEPAGAVHKPVGAIHELPLQGRWVNYTNLNYIRAIAIENVGGRRYAWVATDGGVACWDLNETVTRCLAYYTTASGLQSNDVLCVQVDGQGRKWFGTAAGVSVFTRGYTTPVDLSDDVWQHYSTADGLISDHVQAIGISHGTGGVEFKWIGTDRGVTVLDDSAPGRLRMHSYAISDGLPASYITSISVRNITEVWCGTVNGVAVFSGNNPVISATLVTYTAPGVALASNRIRQIACTAGDVWIATEGGLSRRSAGGTWQSYPPNAQNKLPCAEVVAVDLDGQGNVWLVLGNGWVTAYRDVDAWPIISPTEGLLSGSATCVAYGGEQRMLFGTRGSGISALDTSDTRFNTPERWMTYYSIMGPASNQVTSLAVSTDTLLCGTWGGGASSLHSEVWTHYTDVLGSNYVSAVAFDARGRKWFGTQHALGESASGGLSVLDEAAPITCSVTYLYTGVMPLEYVFSVATVEDSRVWAGMAQGAALIDHHGTPCVTSTASVAVFSLCQCPPGSPAGNCPGDEVVSKCLTSNVVNAIAAGPGEHITWFGVPAGLIVLDDRGTLTSTDDISVTYTMSDGLASNNVYDIFLDGPRYVWVATDSGLCVLDHKGTPFDKTDDRWQIFARDVWVRGIARGQAGHLWLATEQGALHLDYKSDPFETHDDVWEAFTIANGLAGNSVYAVAVHPATGHVWFATDHGLSEFIPASQPVTPTATPTQAGTPIATLAATATPIQTVTRTPTEPLTPTQTVTLTETPTPSETGTVTETPMPTETSSVTETPTPTEIWTRTLTATPSSTPTSTLTPHVVYMPIVFKLGRPRHVLYLPVMFKHHPF